ncbi:MAG: hypothetical protein EA394_02680 [Bacteroidia bacterium]|nr:MAG: hypothetical protein EA394_02680 [Bacteroidia bacterium]
MVKDLIKTILYFDIFAYPLTGDELLLYNGLRGDDARQALDELDKLVEAGMLGYSRGFYYYRGKPAMVDRRLNGNRLAEKRMDAARKYSGIIASFPFVEAVMLSGSIAKGYMGKNDDIDYFIVTKPQRLWLVRSMLVLFKKIFLRNSYRNFCINYFVDTNHLAISEKNRFIATEIAFLQPMFNNEIHAQMMEENPWIKDYYPLPVYRRSPSIKKNKPLKKFFEFLLDHRLTDGIDGYLQRVSEKIIRKKFNHMEEALFERSFSIQSNELRYLPNRQQQRIMNRFCWKMIVFERDSGIQLRSRIYKHHYQSSMPPLSLQMASQTRSVKHQNQRVAL